MAEPVIDFIAIGEQVLPTVPTLRCVPLADANAEALYQRRLEAMRSSVREWLCFVDGGPDLIGADFVPAMLGLARRAADQHVPIGYAAELIRGKAGLSREFTMREFMTNHQVIHHGVVCSVAALNAIYWPEGCHAWEVIAYGTLAQQGFVFDPVPRYDWRPGPEGARRWPSYRQAVINSTEWLRERR